MNLSFRKKAKAPERGKLITVEGIPGSGKSMQIGLLVKALTFAGKTVAVADFPQKDSKARAFLAAQKQNDLTAEARAIFIGLDHVEAREKIEQWLAAGTIVLTSNYVVGNAAQIGIDDAAEQVKFFRWVNNLEYNIFKLPRPELNIILDMPPETAEMLFRKEPGKKINNEGLLAPFKKQAVAIRHAASVYPQTRVIPCTYKGKLFTPQEIHNSIWQLLRRIVFKNKLG